MPGVGEWGRWVALKSTRMRCPSISVPAPSSFAAIASSIRLKYTKPKPRERPDCQIRFIDHPVQLKVLKSCTG